MNRKRKASASNTATAPLSAFAANKARKHEVSTRIAISEESRSATHISGVPDDSGNEALDDLSLDYDSEDGMHEEQLDSIPEKAVDRDFGSWSPSNGNISKTETGERLKFRYGENLTIIGECDLTVLSGIITVNGAVLTPITGLQRIIAPTTEPVPVIRCLSNDGATVALDHVRLGESLKSLSQLSPLFSGMWGEEKPEKSTFKAMYNSMQLQSNDVIKPLNVPLSWQKLCSRLADNTSSARTILLGGPIHSGTSNFLKVLANCLTTVRSKGPSGQRWMFIELNANGSEWTLPGHISISELNTPLLGPSFIRNSGIKIIKQHFVGNNHIKSLDSHFLDCAKDLVDIGRNMNINLILRAPEWYQGSALESNLKLCKMLSPSDLVLLCDDMNAENVQKIAQICPSSCNYLELLETQLRVPRTKAELIDMAFLSHFHHQSSSNLSLDLTPISSWRPLCISYAEGNCDIFGVSVHGQLPSMYPFQLSTLLNGNLVAVIQIDDNLTDGRRISHSEGEAIPFVEPDATGWNQPFDPKHSKTVSVALVRSVDSKNRQLQIILPQLSGELPKGRIVLNVGGYESPSWAYLEEAYHRRREDESIDVLLSEPSFENLPYVSNS